MRIITLAVLLCGLPCAAALAGAWPREPGTGFVSLGYEITTLQDELSGAVAPQFDGYGTLFAEYGLTPRMTIGLDLGGDETVLTPQLQRQYLQQTGSGQLSPPERSAIPQVRTWSGVAFLRYALSPLDATHRFAAQLGVGQRRYATLGRYLGQIETRTEAILRPAIAYGRGFSFGEYSGWLAVDASVEFREQSSGTAQKLDATVGVKGAGKLTYMLQLQGGDFPQAEPYLKVLPAVVVDLPAGLALETALIWGVRGDDSAGVRMALWWSF
ncbi:hypothetical protein AB0T83_04500 [Fluviibacterium sp. DFM31]|uniref:Uncharacterized protein n=1 Tax=Meridianimarinicoccus marinus TaxID=3231483 RepID=A0ABV3L3A1_9RHOB